MLVGNVDQWKEKDWEFYLGIRKSWHLAQLHLKNLFSVFLIFEAYLFIMNKAQNSTNEKE